MAGGVLRLLIYYLDDHVSVLQLPAGRQSERIDKLSATLIHDVDSEYKVETARIDSHRNKITHSAKALAGQIHAANQAVMYGADATLMSTAGGRLVVKLPNDSSIFPSSVILGLSSKASFGS
jgi:hypothetical protein